MTKVQLQKTNLTLPDSVVQAFSGLDMDERDSYIKSLREGGWTLESIARAADLTRERVRQIVGGVGTVPLSDSVPLPIPPARASARTLAYVEPSAATLAELLRLKPYAMKVRSNSPLYRAEAEQYTNLLWYAHTVEKVTVYRLALRLGISHGAIRFRFIRYGLITPKGGTHKLKVYQTIKAENRVLHP